MYSALTIAKYVIDYTNSHGGAISNLKLQKVLYFLQAEFVVTKGNPLFSDKIEAWPTGPIIPSVYRQFQVFGSASIPDLSNSSRYFIFPNERISIDDKNSINVVLEELTPYSATSLSKLTLNQKPWKDAYRKRSYANEITCEALKAYFSE